MIRDIISLRACGWGIGWGAVCRCTEGTKETREARPAALTRTLLCRAAPRRLAPPQAPPRQSTQTPLWIGHTARLWSGSTLPGSWPTRSRHVLGLPARYVDPRAAWDCHLVGRLNTELLLRLDTLQVRVCFDLLRQIAQDGQSQIADMTTALSQGEKNQEELRFAADLLFL